MEIFLGIDLGTTTTLVGRAIEGEKAISVEVLDIKQNDGRGGQIELSYLPSVAFFPPHEKPLVGLEAQMLGPQQDASRYVRAVKRQMGRRILLPQVEREPYEVSALYLAYALQEGRYSWPTADAVFTVTVPASFTTNQRADTLLALRKACDEAGLDYPQQDEGELFISEPVAAMLAFLNQEFECPKAVRRLDLSKKNRVLVYDIGGGTLDLTLVYTEPPPSAQVQSLADLKIYVETIGYYNPFGGEDFDLVLAKDLHRRLLERFPELQEVVLPPDQRLGVRLQLMNLAKSIKEKLSEQISQQEPVFPDDMAEEPSHYYQGEIRVLGTDYSLEGEITESEYQGIVAGLLAGSSRKSLTTPLKDLLEKTRFDSARLDGLLVVGGAARLPLVPETLRACWGNERVWIFNPPDHAVVKGAAIYSYLRRLYPGFVLSEPAADAYYVRLKKKFDLILPARAKEKGGELKRYELPADADRILLQIFAGEEPERGMPIESIYPTLIHQGGTTIALGKKYKKGTHVWVQMRYVGESGEEDHTKVPWVYVWVGDQKGEPLFHLRYSELVREVRNE